MKYTIENVVTATTMAIASIKVVYPEKYTNGEWNAIADALEILIDIGKAADKQNELADNV